MSKDSKRKNIRTFSGSDLAEEVGKESPKMPKLKKRKPGKPNALHLINY